MLKKGQCPFSLAKSLPDEENRTNQVSTIRSAILADPGVFIDQAFETGSVENVQSYLDSHIAISSIYLNFIWEKLKTSPILKEKVIKDKNFWYKLIVNGIGQSQMLNQEAFTAGVIEGQKAFDNAQQGGDSNVSLFAVVLMIQSTLDINIGTKLRIINNMVGLQDLFAITFRFFALIEELIREQVPSLEVENNFRKFLSSGNLMNFLQKLMMNEKHYSTLVLRNWNDNNDVNSATEFVNETDLLKNGYFSKYDREFLVNNELCRFNKSCFRLDLETMELSLTELGQGIIDLSVAIHSQVNSAKNVRRNCPVLYTGMWPQIYDWSRKLALYQLYDDSYPKMAELSSTRLEQLDSALIESFRNGVKDSISKVMLDELLEAYDKFEFKKFRYVV